MKPTYINLCLATIAIGGVGFAQTKGTTDPKGAPAPAISQEKLDVQNLSKFVGLNIKNGDNKVGEIKDLIIDPVDGSIDFVVVSQGGVLGVGEDDRLLPWQSLRIMRAEPDKDDLIATTALTEERLKNAPLCKKGQRIDADLERRAHEAGGVSDERKVSRASGTVLTCAQSVKGTSVKGSANDSIGKVDDVFVDFRHGTVAYVVLAEGGMLGLGEKHYPLPWTQLKVSTDQDEKTVLSSTLTKERLAKAPEYDSKDVKRMGTTPWLRDVYTYYSVEPYWSRTMPASAPRDPSNKPQDGR